MKKSIVLKVVSVLSAFVILFGTLSQGILSIASSLSTAGYDSISAIEADFKAAFYDSKSTISSSAVLITDSTLTSMEKKEEYDNGGYTSLADYLFSLDSSNNLIRDKDYGTISNRKTGFLYYKEKLTDFEMSFDFRINAASTSLNGIYVGFGAETIGEIWANDTDKKGNTAILLQGRDHNVMANGSTTVLSDYKLDRVNYSAVAQKYSNDKTSWFSFKLTVMQGKAVWSIDGNKIAEYSPENYNGGYPYFGTMAVNTAFRNISVKPINSEVLDISDIESKFKGAIYDSSDKNMNDSQSSALITDQTVEQLENYNSYKNGDYNSLVDYMYSIDDDGNLVRDRDYGTSGNKKVGLLYYDTKLNNFTIELEYRHNVSGGKGWQSIYVGFGAQKVGNHAHNDELSGALRLQPSEMYLHWADNTRNYSDNVDFKNTAVTQYESDKENNVSSWYVLKLTVQNGSVIWTLNGKSYSNEISGYVGGYLYFGAMSKDVAFRKIKVTELEDDKPASKYPVYYAKNGTRLDKGAVLNETDFENCWKLDDGTFTRIGSGEYAAGPGSTEGQSLIYLNDKSYEAFKVELDYAIGSSIATYKWAAVGFGADNIGSSYSTGDGYMTFIEQEGYISYFYPNGNSTQSSRLVLTEDAEYKSDITGGNSNWHHLEITVKSDVMTIKRDNGTPYTKNITDYAGYIYISCFTPDMRFKNVSVTELENEDSNWSEGYDAYYIGKDIDYRTKGTAFKPTEPKKVFSYSDETIIRSGSGDFAPATGGVRGMAALTFKEKYTNFVLEYDYSFAGRNDTWKWNSVGFGSKNSGDHFAGAGGFLAYVEQEGYRAYYSGVNSSRIASAIADYEALVKNSGGDTSWHHFKLVVTGDRMEIYLDNYEVAVQSISDYEGGYVSIYSNVTGMKFKNIEINEIKFISSTSSIENIVVPTGTSLDTIALPESVLAVLSDKTEKELAIKEWKCENYDPNTAQTYIFKGELDISGTEIYGGDTGCFINAAVTVADYDTTAVKDYVFTSSNELNNSFYSYYFGSDVQIGKNNATLKHNNADDTWDFTEQGGIKRTGAGKYDGTSSGNLGHAALYFKEKYNEFELDFDYCFNGTTGGWKWIAMGVGVQTLGKTSYEDDGTLVCLEQEGQIRMLGGDPAPLITKTKAFDGYMQSLSDKTISLTRWHHIKIAVKNSTLYVYVDDYPVATTKMDGYEAGYIYIMASTKNLEFENIRLSTIKTAQVVSETAYKTVPVGTSFNEISLPVSLDISVDGKTVACPVKWSSNDYNGGTEGTYVFYATPTGKYSHYWLNQNSKNAIACVSVGNFDNEVVHKFALNSFEELDAYFTGYYCENKTLIKDTGAWRKVNPSSTWGLLDNGIYRAGTGKYAGGAQGAFGVAGLYYNQKLENFEVEFDYRHGTGGWRWLQILGFGAKTIGDNYYNSGYVAYIEREGDVTVKGTINKESDFANPFPADRFMDGYEDKVWRIWDGADEWFHIRLAVLNKTLYIYVDNHPVWRCALDSGYQGGYIYLLQNSDKTEIANLSITNYDAKEVIITSIQSATELGLSVQSIDKTKGDTLSFPSCAVVTDKSGYKYTLPVEWKAPSNYRSGRLGTYEFKGVPIMPSSKFKNPNGVCTPTTVVNSKVDYNTKNTIKYYFDHENDMLDFTNYYSDNAAISDLAPNEWSNQWSIEDGVLQRLNDDFKNTTADTFRTYYKMARLTYNEPLEGNYQIELEYKKASDTWMWPMLCFSIADRTKFMVTYDNGIHKKFMKEPLGGTAVYLEQEGSVNYWGNMVSANLDDIRIRMLKTIDKFDGYDGTKLHKIKFTFIDGVARIAVDDYETTVAARIPDKSLGEYVAIMTNSNAACFDNFSITRLSDTTIDWVEVEPDNVEIKDSAVIVKQAISNSENSTVSFLAIAVVGAAAVIFFVSVIILYKSKSKKNERK